MSEKLLSVKDLSDRWGKDEGTIRRYVKEGALTPCSGVPGMMFHPSYIAKLEDVELERFSPLEKRRMEMESQKKDKEIKTLYEKIEDLQQILREYQLLNVKSLNLICRTSCN